MKRLLRIILCSYHFIFRTKDKHCTKLKLSCKKGTSYSIFIYLCPPKWFRIRIQRTMINREPGVNPGQSRCCETPFNFLIFTFTTDQVSIVKVGKASGRESVRRPAIHTFIVVFTRGIGKRQTVKKESSSHDIGND